MYAFYELSPVERERKIAVRAELLLFAWYQRIRSVQHETAGRIAICRKLFPSDPVHIPRRRSIPNFEFPWRWNPAVTDTAAQHSRLMSLLDDAFVFMAPISSRNLSRRQYVGQFRKQLGSLRGEA